jgi:hypothetical protein
MSSHNQVALGTAIEQVLSDLHLSQGVFEARIESRWHEWMGPMIARHTTEIKLQHKRLYVVVDSAALRNELFYSRDKIKEIINREIEHYLINDVFIY